MPDAVFTRHGLYAHLEKPCGPWWRRTWCGKEIDPRATPPALASAVTCSVCLVNQAAAEARLVSA